MPEDSTTPHAATDVIASYDRAHDWHSLNAMLNLYDKQGRIQFDKDIQAVREYVEKHVLPNTVRFNSTQDRLSRLIADGYYDESVFAQYDAEFLDRFYRNVDDCGFEFDTFLGAFKFHRSYALKTFDGKQYLENFPQRAAAVALALAAATMRPPNRISKNLYQDVSNRRRHFPQPRQGAARRGGQLFSRTYRRQHGVHIAWHQRRIAVEQTRWRRRAVA